MYTVPVSSSTTLVKNPKTTLATVVNVGKANGNKPWWQTLLLSWHGGVFIAFGAALGCALAGMVDTMQITGSIPNSDGGTSTPISLHLSVPVALQRFALGGTFPFALTLILLTGSELFTGNVMFIAASRWAQQITWFQLMKNMVFSYFGNIAGTLTVAYFLIHLTKLYEPESIREFVFSSAQEMVYNGTFGINVLKGKKRVVLFICNIFCARYWFSASLYR